MKVELETTLLAAVSDLSSARDLPSVTRAWPIRGAVATCEGEAAKKGLALHGGTVSASSDGPNQGTSVRVEFPIPQVA
jgi:hypothetical protein